MVAPSVLLARQVGGGRLHAGDLGVDFLSCLGGLGNEGLHLLRHDGETAAGFTGARGSSCIQASRLVCSATEVISWTTSPCGMRPEPDPRCALGLSARTASPEILRD